MIRGRLQALIFFDHRLVLPKILFILDSGDHQLLIEGSQVLIFSQNFVLQASQFIFLKFHHFDGFGKSLLLAFACESDHFGLVRVSDLGGVDGWVTDRRVLILDIIERKNLIRRAVGRRRGYTHVGHKKTVRVENLLFGILDLKGLNQLFLRKQL